MIKQKAARLDKIRGPVVRCPLTGRMVLTADEALHGPSCNHCEFYERSTQRSVYCEASLLLSGGGKPHDSS